MAVTTVSCRLRHIVWPADFRRSDATLYAELPAAVRRELKGDDVVCFVSGTGNQVLFVYMQRKVGLIRNTRLKKTRPRQLTHSVRLRLNAGRFSPDMLANYAAECGIQLRGIKSFEDHYAYLLSEGY